MLARPIHEKKDFCGGDGFFKNPYKIPKFGGKSKKILIKSPNLAENPKNWRRFYLQKLWFFGSMAEGCDKVRGPVDQTLGKNGSKYFRISRWEKNIWEIFAHRRAGQGKFLFSSVFLSTTWLLYTQNFRLPWPALRVFLQICLQIFD